MSATPPFPPVHAPARLLMVYVTEQCNLRCSYCFVEKKPRHMSVETMRKTIDFFFHRNISGPESNLYLTFFGGEPFTRLDCLEEGVAYARAPRPNSYKSIEFSATTNGTVIGPRVERLVRESRMSLLVSLDGGIGASSHRQFVSGRPSYETVARNLPRLVAWSPRVIVRMTFHPGALDLVENVRHALDLGAPAIMLCPVVEANWAGHEATLDEAYQALAEMYVAEARRGRILPLEMTNNLLRDHDAAARGGARPGRPCNMGTSLIGVDPDGNVMPCHRFLYRRHDHLGTVARPVFDEARWRYVHLASSDIQGCDDCAARPVCGGGCRSVVMNSGRGLYETHPGHCLTMRAHARAVAAIYERLMGECNGHFKEFLLSSRRHDPVMAELGAR